MSYIDKIIKAFFEAVKTITAGLLGGALMLLIIEDKKIFTNHGFVILLIAILFIITAIFYYCNYIIEKTEETEGQNKLNKK